MPNLSQPEADAAIAKLTLRQRQVYDALTNNFKSGSQIAQDAKIFTYSPAETASKFAIQLTKLGLAEKGGTRSAPRWRRKQH